MGESFVQELNELLKKYNVRVESHDIYDGEENYKGEDLYLIINGEPYYAKTVFEIFEEIKNNLDNK